MLNSVTNLSISLQNPKPIIGKSTPQGTALSFVESTGKCKFSKNA